MFKRRAPQMTAPLPVPNSLFSKMDFALEAARRGARVYPMAENSEEPALPEGDCFATTDESQVREWWQEDPARNVGLSAEDALVIRITERCPQNAVADFAALLKAKAVLPTVRVVRSEHYTPALAICFFYKLPIGTAVAGRQDAFGPGIDVLSTDDVVLGPGSTLPRPGKCEFHGDSMMADATPWLLEMCGVQLPEGKPVTNVISMKRQPAAAAKTKLEWALEAAEYIPVHPLRWYVDPGPGASPEELEKAAKAAKAALLTDWPNKASQDPDQIRKWWTQWPDANIGGATQNHIVVDLDPRNGGEETMTALLAVENFPDTATTRTQSGGQHLIYVAPDGAVKGGTDKLGPGVDIKARGGYVVMPGSTIAGRTYIRENVRPPAFAPQWLVDQLKAAKPKTNAAGKRIVEEDDTAVERATTWMIKHAPTAEEGNRDNTAYRVMARVYDEGVTRETGLEILTEWNDLKCFPPLDLDDLERIAESAGRNRENAIGSRHPLAGGFDAHEIAERPAEAPREPGNSVPTAPAATGLATPLLQFDPVGLELRPWVIPGFACRGRVTLLAGPGGVAKSTYYLMVAIATVSGRSDICGFPILKRERVWVWNQEDDIAEMQRRVAAIMKEFDVSWEDLKDEDGSPMLFLDSGVDKPLMLANRSAEHSIVPGKQVADVIATAKANRIAVLILDPLVEFHEASENDNVQMRAVVGQVRRIAVEADCAAMLSTHTRKPPVASSDGFAGEMDAARGASAQLGVVRIGATIFSMSPKQAKEHRLAEGTTHLDYVRIDIAKNNLAPVLPDPIWFKRVGVRVGGGFEQNGESVGVLRPVTLDKKVATSSTVHLPTVLAEIIATKLSREKHFKVSEVLASATPAQQALFGDKKNRARCITDSFDGTDASPTDAGFLTKTSARGKEMTLYLGPTSSLLQQQKTGGRGSENDENTET
jgi:Bifunctional DNA primase/polymerase, N-terminal/AAA domain/Primase C terminal 1 (PriCT-1)